MNKDQFAKWEAYVNALNIRERSILFMVVLLVFVVVFYIALLEPSMKKRKILSEQLATAERTILQKEAEINGLETQLEGGIFAAQEARKARLQAELEELNSQLEKAVVALVPPKLMPSVLEKMLAEQDKLEFLGIENKTVEPLLLATELESQQEDRPRRGVNRENRNRNQELIARDGLYKHAFVLRLRGGYRETVEYFKTLEGLPWRFYWDELVYEVDEYPNAVVTLEVHTVSTQREWIGV